MGGELALISWIQSRLRADARVLVDSGDDAAVVRAPRGPLLLKTDTVVERTHFTRATARQIGHKAMGKPLSDFAAMGCRPAFALVAVGLPPSTSMARARGIFLGMEALARRFGVRIVGGDVVTTHGPLFVTVSVAGGAGNLRPILRSGARPGDTLFVTGRLGQRKHLRFTPRIREGLALNRSGRVHAMIDITDGLVRDLAHLCRAGGVGAELDARAIPRARGATLDTALYGGEDFELLFAARARRVRRATAVGRIVRARGIRLDGRRIAERGYEHRFGDRKSKRR
jgi:thiamine-monophosphate kinase